MTIKNVIDKLHLLDEDLFICARRPWKESSECILVYPTESLGAPQHVEDAGYHYLLSVYDARDLVEHGPAARPLSRDEKVKLVLFFAENDAYPEWVYGEPTKVAPPL